MPHLKIDYGIDLGTTNSSICRMENGEIRIIKTDTLKDTMPSCVSCTKKKSIRVGDSAYNDMKSDKRRATKTWRALTSNTYIEFKRTMGTDTTYHSSNMDQDYSSEELSAEVLKTLKSFVQDENIQAAVITVPAKFTMTQKDATMRAAKLAGFEHCELLQEPIAASMAYGLNSNQKNGYWMVFDFGGGTFDAALLKVEDGIIQVFDTAGDNYLGGKNLDYAIVDGIIIPYLKKNFAIDSYLTDEEKKLVLRDAMKTYAEEAKNQLSFKTEYDIQSDLGDLGEDEDGNEIELDLTITQEELSGAFSPIFQKAVDICMKLLERNNMNGNQLSSLILVGGPTHSPILRSMLKEQITPNVRTDIDPMTAVACGAALYASTIDNEVKQELQIGTIAFNIEYDPTTVETIVYIPIKLDKTKCTGELPPNLFVELIRSDKAWSSGKKIIDEKGDIIECQLLEGKSNSLIIKAYDEKGASLPCFPNEINIIQGSKSGSAVLPYNIGIEIWDSNKNKSVFKSISGLEKNKQLPATGIINDLKTTSDLRPGIKTDIVKIPILQGDTGSDGIRAAYFEHVYDAIITGESLPALLPTGSDAEITLKVDRSERMTMEVFFPLLDYSNEIKVPTDTVQKEVSEKYLVDEISKAYSNIDNLEDENEDVSNLRTRLDCVQDELNNGDQHKQVLEHLKEVLRDIDRLDKGGEWDRLEKELRSKFDMLEEDNGKYGDDQTSIMVEQIKEQVDETIRTKNNQAAKDLLNTMFRLNFKLARVEYYVAWVVDWQRNFNSINWKDANHARALLNQGVDIINNAPTAEKLQPIVSQLIKLSPSDKIPEGAGGLLGES